MASRNEPTRKELREMTTTQTTRLPWLFFVGPDGVVRTSRNTDQKTTQAALVGHGLADRLVR